MRLKVIFNLLRFRQYYKNLLIFLPLVFSHSLLDLPLWPSYFAGFALLCLISSSSYIINDVIDAEKDKKNIEKKHRPIASGAIKPYQGIIIAILLGMLTLVFSYRLSTIFFFYIIVLFFISQMYTFFFKHHIYTDVIAIGVNFVLRSLSGYSFEPNLRVSPWLVLCAFFFAIFLSTGKRYGELKFLKKASGHRATLLQYDESQLESMLNISSTMFLTTGILFPIFSDYGEKLIYITPIFVYIIFKFLFLIKSGSIIGRHAEKFYQDKGLLAAISLYAILAVILIYT